MNPLANLFGRLRIRGKFLALFAVQMVLLVAVAAGGGTTIDRVGRHLTSSGSELE